MMQQKFNPGQLDDSPHPSTSFQNNTHSLLCADISIITSLQYTVNDVTRAMKSSQILSLLRFLLESRFIESASHSIIMPATMAASNSVKTIQLITQHGHDTHTQPFHSSLDFVQDNLDQPVPEETFTHSHLSWSSVIPYLIPPSITIHGILPVQFMCLTVFFRNISPSFVWSTSWPGTLTSYSIHFFTQSSSLRSTCPYHRNLFCCST